MRVVLSYFIFFYTYLQHGSTSRINRYRKAGALFFFTTVLYMAPAKTKIIGNCFPKKTVEINKDQECAHHSENLKQGLL